MGPGVYTAVVSNTTDKDVVLLLSTSEIGSGATTQGTLSPGQIDQP